MDDFGEKSGVVYILKNEAMPGLVKIGRTVNLRERMYQLDTSGVPLPFECFFAKRVHDMAFVESHLHAAFADQRLRKSREFFSILPERVKAALDIAQGQEVTVNESSVVETPDDLISLEKAKTRRPPFKFSMIEGATPGTTLTHTHSASATCTVYDDHNVLFEGQVMSLSKSAGIVLKRLGLGDAVAGTDYWSLNGATLWDLRNQAEQLGKD
jgi:hypothetical protein